MQKKKVSRIVSLMSLSEIFLFVMSIFAISFFFSQTNFVSAVNPPSSLKFGEGGNPGLYNNQAPSTLNTGSASGSSAAAAAKSTETTGGGSEVGIGGLVTKIFGGTMGGLYGPLIAGVAWGATLAGVVLLLGNLFGLEKQLTNALAASIFVGSVAGGGVAALVNAFGAGANSVTGTGVAKILGTEISASGVGAVTGIAVAAIIFVLIYKKEKKKIVQLQCLPWEAPLGGADCEKCNGDPLKPCSEYRCKSLGQACELLNKGTEEERCTWFSRNDVNSPTITPNRDFLTSGYIYTRHDTRPPSLGTKIQKTAGGCVAPFTPLEFGFVTNEPAQCKIDYTRPLNASGGFEQMQFYVGDSNYYAYNHSQIMRLPSPESLNLELDAAGAPELKNDGTQNFYVRCRDANGNENVDDFVFTFCVDPSPDTTPPVIEATSIISGSPVTFGVQNVSVTAYINEPAECKWSSQDKNYNDMENSMTCSTSVYEQNAQQLYPCTTMLTGIKDRADNAFYFRCKDQPRKADSERNVNTQSYNFVLKGSQGLNILSTSPNGTITGSTEAVRVSLGLETSNGAEEGKAACSFSPTGREGTFISMFDTGTFQHNQTLTLTPGNYTYYFRCSDAGGNAANSSTRFNIFVDRNAPTVTRVYKEGVDALKVVTNEDAECVYSLNSCNYVFAEGVKFLNNPVTEKKLHFIRWEQYKTYYVKCRDSYDNQPAPSACSIIAKPITLK